MSIKTIVEQALEQGDLTPLMEGEITQICEAATELSTEEYSALDELMKPYLTYVQINHTLK